MKKVVLHSSTWKHTGMTTISRIAVDKPTKPYNWHANLVHFQAKPTREQCFWAVSLAHDMQTLVQLQEREATSEQDPDGWLRDAFNGWQLIEAQKAVDKFFNEMDHIELVMILDTPENLSLIAYSEPTDYT